MREQKASTSFVQRHLKIGYNRAATIIEDMERNGVISAANHVGKRDVLISNDADQGGCNDRVARHAKSIMLASSGIMSVVLMGL